MPKYIINGSGDQFFCPDSSQFYFNDLKGEKHLRYVPNVDHSVDDDFDAVINTNLRAVFVACRAALRPMMVCSIVRQWQIAVDGSTRRGTYESA